MTTLLQNPGPDKEEGAALRPDARYRSPTSVDGLEALRAGELEPDERFYKDAQRLEPDARLRVPTAVSAPGTYFEEIGQEIGQLVAKKDSAYGSAFARAGGILRILYPNGISLEQLDDALAVTRIVDKLFRIATDRDALGEDPWSDISGYGILGVARRRGAK